MTKSLLENEKLNALDVPCWEAYFEAVKSMPPHETAIQALEIFGGKAGVVVDLGAGNGRDARFMLSKGWQVFATDQSEGGLASLQAELPEPLKANLTTQAVSFENLQLTVQADWVNASYCLPFCPKKNFPALWSQVLKSLKIGGIFSGQFFGPHDDWAQSCTTWTREEVNTLFQGFSFVRFDEEETYGPIAVGGMKHWHIFHVVARKSEA